MSYVGKWQFHSIGTVDDETCERVWLNAEEYMKSPMPYVDESDEEAVAGEMKERKNTVGTILEVCEDGKLYALMPLPEGVSKEEVEAAASAGVKGQKRIAFAISIGESELKRALLCSATPSSRFAHVIAHPRARGCAEFGS